MPTKTEEYARPATPPDSSSLTTVREAAENCTACHLYKRATQTVFGEGPKKAAMMLVGEQPGDYEDVAGKPFVGPAGKFFLQSSPPKSWPRSILRRCCASRMKNRDTANTKTSSPISGLRSLRRTPTKTSASPTLLAPGWQLSFPSAQALQILLPKFRLNFSNKRRSLLHCRQCPSWSRSPRPS